MVCRCWPCPGFDGVRFHAPRRTSSFKSIAKVRSNLRSNVEQEVQHVAVLDHVLLAFGTHLAGFLGTLFALVGEEVGEGDRLRADETSFEVGMDDAGGLRCRVTAVNGPRLTSLTPAVK